MLVGGGGTVTRAQLDADIQALRRVRDAAEAAVRRQLRGVHGAWKGGGCETFVAEGEARRITLARAFDRAIDEAARLRGSLPEQ